MTSDLQPLAAAILRLLGGIPETGLDPFPEGKSFISSETFHSVALSARVSVKDSAKLCSTNRGASR